MAEQNRIMFPPVDNPLRQPLARIQPVRAADDPHREPRRKVSRGEGDSAISKSERANAEAAAKDEVRAAVAQYCGAQPNAGAGIQLCEYPLR